MNSRVKIGTELPAFLKADTAYFMSSCRSVSTDFEMRISKQWFNANLMHHSESRHHLRLVWQDTFKVQNDQTEIVSVTLWANQISECCRISFTRGCYHQNRLIRWKVEVIQWATSTKVKVWLIKEIPWNHAVTWVTTSYVIKCSHSTE